MYQTFTLIPVRFVHYNQMTA